MITHATNGRGTVPDPTQDRAPARRQKAGTLNPAGSNRATGVECSFADRPPLQLARELYAQRRLRDRMFDGVVPLGEPGWDMLLDLFIAHQEGRMIRVTSACIGSVAPPTTGLRMLGQLEQRGLVQRHPELTDRRSSRVTLTPEAVTLLIDFLTSIPALSGKGSF